MLNADQTEMLAELLNIAFGRATAPLARLMGRFVVLTPPEVDLIQRASAGEFLEERFGSDARAHVVQQAFQPTLRGEAVLVMRADKGAHAWGLFADPMDEPDEDEEKDAALEVGNLLVGACIGRLADLLGTSVRYTPPHLKLFDQPLSELDLRQGPDVQLLVVHTRFSVEGTPFESTLFLVVSPSVLAWLQRTLDRILDEYLSIDGPSNDAGTLSMSLAL